MLLTNGNNLQTSLHAFIQKATRLVIFSPYIKLDKLKELLQSTDKCEGIIVRWELKDLVQGASDLEVYDFCQSKQIFLYRNPRLHQKAYVDDFASTCLLTTANISQRALNDGTDAHYNYELGTIVNIDFADRIYFQTVLNDSMLVDHRVIKDIRKQLSLIDLSKPIVSDIDLVEIKSQKDFLISALPMSVSIQTLYQIYKSPVYTSSIDYSCAVHDIALYQIPLGLSESDFRQTLQHNFFAHPFIQAFLVALDNQPNQEFYFGAVRHWLTDNCANVPTPRPWELTNNVQILYKWIVELGAGKYQMDVPGRRSERLKKLF